MKSLLELNRRFLHQALRLLARRGDPPQRGKRGVPRFLQLRTRRRGHEEAHVPGIALERRLPDEVLRLLRRIPDHDDRLVGIDHRAVAAGDRAAGGGLGDGIDPEKTDGGCKHSAPAGGWDFHDAQSGTAAGCGVAYDLGSREK